MSENTNQTTPTEATEGTATPANPTETTEGTAQVDLEISPEELRLAAEELKKMTPARFAAFMAALEQSQEAARQSIGEAPVVIFGKLKSKKGAIWSLTVRGPNFMWALDQLAAAITYGKEKYKLTPCDTAEPPAPNQAAVAATVAAPPALILPPASAPGATLTPPPPGAPAGAPAPAATQPQLNTIHIAKIGVTPVAGGKVTVAFFGDEHKQPSDDFPSVTNTMPIDKAVDLFAPIGQWTAQYFTAANEYMVNCWLIWKEGRANPKTGKPYKDIVRLELPRQ